MPLKYMTAYIFQPCINVIFTGSPYGACFPKSDMFSTDR